MYATLNYKMEEGQDINVINRRNTNVEEIQYIL